MTELPAELLNQAAHEIFSTTPESPEALFRRDLDRIISDVLALTKKWNLNTDHDAIVAALQRLEALPKFIEQKTPSSLVLFGTEGNRWGKTIVGGSDADAINAMLQAAFDDGRAGLPHNPSSLIGHYKGRNVHEQQAADQIRISLADDGRAYVKLIIRGADPGLGLLALAGGFKEKNESDEAAANREEQEEAADVEAHGAPSSVLAKYQIARHPVKGDVRQWGGKDRPDGVQKGDLIALSTTAMVIVAKNAHGEVEAGDDARNAAWIPVDRFDGNTAALFGIKSHAEMLGQALSLAKVTLSPHFSQAVKARLTDIAVATPELAAAAQSFMKPSETGGSQPQRPSGHATPGMEPSIN